MLRAWKLRLARRAFTRAAIDRANAIKDFSVPLEVAMLRAQEATQDMGRAHRRIWELRHGA